MKKEKTKKTHGDYYKEYNNILKEHKSIEARIKKRAYEMVKNQPLIKMDMYESKHNVLDFYLNVDSKLKPEYKTKQFLRIIKVIEDHNKENAKIKQLEMFKDIN